MLYNLIIFFIIALIIWVIYLLIRTKDLKEEYDYLEQLVESISKYKQEFIITRDKDYRIHSEGGLSLSELVEKQKEYAEYAPDTTYVIYQKVATIGTRGPVRVTYEKTDKETVESLDEGRREESSETSTQDS